MWPIIALHEANLATGGIGGLALPAPQAGLMAGSRKGSSAARWRGGCSLSARPSALRLILSGVRSPMLVAVGMYLPFDTTSAIFVGGVLRYIVDRFTKQYSPERKALVEERGTLLASGLIAGEAILGILIAVLAVRNIPSFTHMISGSDQFSFYPAWSGWLSLVGFAAIAWTLIRIPLRAGK